MSIFGKWNFESVSSEMSIQTNSEIYKRNYYVVIFYLFISLSERLSHPLSNGGIGNFSEF